MREAPSPLKQPGTLKSSKFRWAHRLSKTSPDGRHVIWYGPRVGYWPCLEAPVLQISLGKHIFEFWYGLPSYKERKDAAAGTGEGVNPSAAAKAERGSK
jgi:hypothetical protein